MHKVVKLPSLRLYCNSIVPPNLVVPLCSQHFSISLDSGSHGILFCPSSFAFYRMSYKWSHIVNIFWVCFCYLASCISDSFMLLCKLFALFVAEYCFLHEHTSYYKYSCAGFCLNRFCVNLVNTEELDCCSML